RNSVPDTDVFEMGVYQAINSRLQYSDDQRSEQAQQSLKDTLAGLFPDVATLNENGQTDWQNIAAASACLQRFTVITGGPGTGKTTTVTRLLSALLSQAEDGKTLHIALAAPTGKAAARMTESIRAAKQRGNLANAEQIPDSSFTLHRLLGWSPQGFRYHRDHPLPYDCVVVDEASMIDLPMMFHLMTALAANTRLILLGDRDQLASVEAGSVLADLCDAGNEHAPSAEFSQRLSRITGQNLQALNPALAMSGESPGNAMQNALAQLRVSHRFTADSGIGQLAAAVNAGEVKPALACFNRFDDIDLQWLQDSNARSSDTQWYRSAGSGRERRGSKTG
ncbi:MAG: AAA family ATPase, partial [Pseudomonadota bacterium]